jgi:subfamily B ATP-binding cassette protein MsbA
MGGGFSSRSAKAERRRGGPPRPDETPKKKGLPLAVLLRDAGELIHARRGRLALGFGLLAVSRLAGLVLPGLTKILLDDVIGKHRRDLLEPLVLAAAAATLIQAITGFALSQVLGKAAQRSITEMRRAVQAHVGRLRVAFFDQTKTGVLLSRVMTDAEGIRNLAGTGLVELAAVPDVALRLAILFYFSAKLTLIALAVCRCSAWSCCTPSRPFGRCFASARRSTPRSRAGSTNPSPASASSRPTGRSGARPSCSREACTGCFATWRGR